MQSSIQPSRGFVLKVMNEVTRIEQRRRLRLNIGFGVLAVTPFVLRQCWFLVRGDFFALSEFPLNTFLIPVYNAFLSSLSGYVFVAGGIILAVYVLGFPRLKMPFFGMALKK